MKIGTYLVNGEGTPEERLRMTKAAGFDYICLSMSMFDGTGLTPEICDKVGIEFDNVHLTGEKTTLIWAPGDEGEEVMKRYCNEIRIASELGIRTGIVHVTWGWKIQPYGPDEVGLSRYRKIAECAEKYNFTIAVENSCFPTHIYAVLDGIPSKAFAHCYDSGHHNAFAPAEDFLGKYGDRLVATHIQDNDGKHDLHILPFDGTVDWNRVARELAKCPVAREKICAEVCGPAGRGVRQLPGMTADEIRACIAPMPVASTKDVKIGDGYAEFYADVSYEEYLDRLHERLCRLGSMIEKEAALLK